MIIHKTLSTGRWFEFSIVEQLANIGCDIDRAIRWRNAGNIEHSKAAFERALELIDFTIADPKNKGGGWREVVRTREALVDYFAGDNIYNTTDKIWQDYFFNFNYLAAIRRGK